MDNQQMTMTALRKVAELRDLASMTASAALTAELGRQSTVLSAAEHLRNFADSLERKAKKGAVEPAIAVVHPDATGDELGKARRRQATRRGTDVYLPTWSAMAQALPNAFLRTAIFSSGRSVQADSVRVLSGDETLLVAGKKIASFKNMTLTFSGYELCQFDRQVYATCLDYYREKPLSPDESQQHISASFYEFACRMGGSYGLNTHKAVRASLLRLSFAQMRMRYERMNLELPKLLAVSFQDGEAGGDFKGSDIILFRVTVAVAELFGPGAWTAVDKEVVAYDELLGWLASFYAGHSKPFWLPVTSLYELSGYESHIGNFRASLIRSLNKLMHEQTPICCRVSKYEFSDDGRNLLVIRSKWNVRQIG